MIRRQALPDNECHKVLGNKYFYNHNDLPRMNTIRDQIVEQHAAAFRLAVLSQGFSRGISVGSVVLMEFLRRNEVILEKDGYKFFNPNTCSIGLKQIYQDICALPSPKNYSLVIE